MMSFLEKYRSPLLLAFILLLGFGMRLGLAAHEGYSFDVSTNAGWGRTALINGVATSYTEQIENTMMPDYPPFSLMIYKEAMRLHRIFSPEFIDESLLQRIFIKLPSIFGDLLVAAAFYIVIRRLRGEQDGLLAAILWLLHPATWLDSAVWGQTDVIFSWMSLVAALALISGGTVLGGAMAVLAVLTKFQGVMFLPLFAVLALQKPKKLHWPTLGAVLVIAIVFLPFAMKGTLSEMLLAFTRPVGSYADLSVNAYNFWWAMFADAARDHLDTEPFFLGISYRNAGIAFVGALYLWLLWKLWIVLRSTDVYIERLEAVLGVGALCAMAFFTFNTEMHERYLFSFVVFGFPLIFLRRAYVMPYILIGLLFCLNLVGVLQVTPIEKALYEAFPALDVVIATCQVILFFVLLRRVQIHALTPRTHRRKFADRLLSFSEMLRR